MPQQLPSMLPQIIQQPQTKSPQKTPSHFSSSKASMLAPWDSSFIQMSGDQSQLIDQYCD